MAKEVKKTQEKNNKKKAEEKVVKNSVKDKKVEKNVKEEKKEAVTKKVETVKPEKVKIKKEKNNEKLVTLFKKVDDKRFGIILFVVGFLIATLLFRCILWPDRIATLKDGTQPIATLNEKTITADDLYENMKSYYSVNVLLNEIDDIILSKKYKETDEMNEEIKSTAEYYYSMYEKQAGYTKEQFLSEYGFASEDSFLDNLRLDYRRNKYYEEYVLSLITDKEVEKYYKDDVFGDVDSKHILVSVAKDDKEGLSDEEAKKLANEIIKKLDSGTSWDDVVKEYKDQITSEDLGYNAFNASLESAYLKECKDLKVGTYSKSPVLTSYGYHIVYKKAQKDKPELDSVKDDVKDILAKEKKENDTNLYYKALIKLRADSKLEFNDTKLKDEYKTYVNKYEK
ncbi:MAG: peptidylprolyl isomerase [Erysipelotrichaceae bacterium]|nr:peptidylprolyl isomerase [Erysipelotrichaceae bacterium]